MWIKREQYKRMRNRLSDLESRTASLESYMFVRGPHTYPTSDRTWRNSVSLREIVFALATHADLGINIEEGGSAKVDLVPLTPREP